NYVADDMLVYIYDVNNMQLITPSVTGIKAAYYKFEASFITSDKLSYRLIIHQATTNANVVVLYFDDFKIGPQERVMAAPVGPYDISGMTISAGFGTTTNVKWDGERQGRWLIGTGRFTMGTAAASVASIDLPSGLTIDYS